MATTLRPVKAETELLRAVDDAHRGPREDRHAADDQSNRIARHHSQQGENRG